MNKFEKEDRRVVFFSFFPFELELFVIISTTTSYNKFILISLRIETTDGNSC